MINPTIDADRRRRAPALGGLPVDPRPARRGAARLAHPLRAASTRDGRPVGGEVTGFHAGVVQHEYDHLDGILYPMRMTDFSLFGFTEELVRAGLGQPAPPPEPRR